LRHKHQRNKSCFAKQIYTPWRITCGDEENQEEEGGGGHATRECHLLHPGLDVWIPLIDLAACCYYWLSKRRTLERRMGLGRVYIGHSQIGGEVSGCSKLELSPPAASIAAPVTFWVPGAKMGSHWHPQTAPANFRTQ
jgi:hypothetical protein